MMYTLFQTTVAGTDDALPVTHLYGLICAFYTTPDKMMWPKMASERRLIVN
jgi:hypothetical protein